MRTILVSLFLMFLVAARGVAQTLPPELIRYADLILYNGKVLTADRDDADFTVAEALAVRDGRILFVGKSADALKYGGPQSARIDLKGRNVIPGIIASDGDNAFAAGDLYKYVQVGKKLIGGGRSLRVPPTREAIFAKISDMMRGVAPGEMVFLRFRDEINGILWTITKNDLDNGYRNAAVMEEGFSGWLRRKYPVESGTKR